MTGPEFMKLYDSLPSKGWLTIEEARLLYSQAQRVDGPILEVGCYHGRSTCLLANLGRQMYCVDPFIGFDSDDPSGGGTMASWCSNVAERGYNADQVKLFTQKIEDWLVRPVGFAYLDGDHTYQGTVNQIAAAQLCGAKTIAVHDVNDKGEGLAIKRACLELLGPWTVRVQRLAVWENVK